MKTIVFTGGPCAGKTTVMRALKDEFGDKIYIVPEVATMLLSGGFPSGDQFEDFDQLVWLESFQKAIFPVIEQLESVGSMHARIDHAKVVICDRGLLDAAGYLPGGLVQFQSLFGIDQDEVYKNYDMVVHLESVAVCNPELYGKTGNSARYESVETAAKLDQSLRNVWSAHPNWVLIRGNGGITNVIDLAVDLVSSVIDIEYERKYVLPEMPLDLNLSDVVEIEQGYLITDQGELRLRRMGEQTIIGIKGDGGFARGQWEKRLPSKFFDQLWPLTEGKRVRKTRYVHVETFLDPKLNMTWEIDVYHDGLTGLITAECEFPGDEEVDPVDILPEWLEDAIDVTDDSRYKNKNLAVNGLPV